MKILLKLPLLIILIGIAGLAMLVPMAHAFRISDFLTARVFFQISIFVLLLTSLMGIATFNYRPPKTAHSQLFALFVALILLPLILALPFRVLLPSASLLDAYFEMLSSFTTTGATLFDETSRLSDPLHLWRGLVGWLGGLLMWVAAIAIMAPLNLGGYEVFSSETASGPQKRGGGWIKSATTSDRLIRYTVTLAPIYLLITLALTLGLVLSGERFFIAVIHAMSTVSTSGISPVSGLEGANAGWGGELLIFCFLIFAVTRVTISGGPIGQVIINIFNDREFRLAAILVLVLPTLLFFRHWIGAIEVNEQENLMAGVRAFWGAAFTVLSFLTTTGFESADWHSAQDWSGLKTPGLILMGLSIVGGGIATTAGGVKLLRVYALYKHGLREMQKLSFPKSVGGAGSDARRIRRQGAYYAWIFFMLFALSAAIVMLGLSLTGIDFEGSLIMAIATLGTTGPLVNVASDTALSYAQIGDLAKGILCAAMVMGRLETLAIIALLNPEFWRN